MAATTGACLLKQGVTARTHTGCQVEVDVLQRHSFHCNLRDTNFKHIKCDDRHGSFIVVERLRFPDFCAGKPELGDFTINLPLRPDAKKQLANRTSLKRCASAREDCCEEDRCRNLRRTSSEPRPGSCTDKELILVKELSMTNAPPDSGLCEYYEDGYPFCKHKRSIIKMPFWLRVCGCYPMGSCDDLDKPCPKIRSKSQTRVKCCEKRCLKKRECLEAKIAKIRAKEKRGRRRKRKKCRKGLKKKLCRLEQLNKEIKDHQEKACSYDKKTAEETEDIRKDLIQAEDRHARSALREFDNRTKIRKELEMRGKQIKGESGTIKVSKSEVGEVKAKRKAVCVPLKATSTRPSVINLGKKEPEGHKDKRGLDPPEPCTGVEVCDRLCEPTAPRSSSAPFKKTRFSESHSPERLPGGQDTKSILKMGPRTKRDQDEDSIRPRDCNSLPSMEKTSTRKNNGNSVQDLIARIKNRKEVKKVLGKVKKLRKEAVKEPSAERERESFLKEGDENFKKTELIFHSQNAPNNFSISEIMLPDFSESSEAKKERERPRIDGATGGDTVKPEAVTGPESPPPGRLEESAERERNFSSESRLNEIGLEKRNRVSRERLTEIGIPDTRDPGFDGPRGIRGPNRDGETGKDNLRERKDNLESRLSPVRRVSEYPKDERSYGTTGDVGKRKKHIKIPSLFRLVKNKISKTDKDVETELRGKTDKNNNGKGEIESEIKDRRDVRPGFDKEKSEMIAKSGPESETGMNREKTVIEVFSTAGNIDDELLIGNDPKNVAGDFESCTRVTALKEKSSDGTNTTQNLTIEKQKIKREGLKRTTNAPRNRGAGKDEEKRKLSYKTSIKTKNSVLEENISSKEAAKTEKLTVPNYKITREERKRKHSGLSVKTNKILETKETSVSGNLDLKRELAKSSKTERKRCAKRNIRANDSEGMLDEKTEYGKIAREHEDRGNRNVKCEERIEEELRFWKRETGHNLEKEKKKRAHHRSLKTVEELGAKPSALTLGQVILSGKSRSSLSDMGLSNMNLNSVLALLQMPVTRARGGQEQETPGRPLKEECLVDHDAIGILLQSAARSETFADTVVSEIAEKRKILSKLALDCKATSRMKKEMCKNWEKEARENIKEGKKIILEHGKKTKNKDKKERDNQKKTCFSSGEEDIKKISSLMKAKEKELKQTKKSLNKNLKRETKNEMKILKEVDKRMKDESREILEIKKACEKALAEELKLQRKALSEEGEKCNQKVTAISKERSKAIEAQSGLRIKCVSQCEKEMRSILEYEKQKPAPKNTKDLTDKMKAQYKKLMNNSKADKQLQKQEHKEFKRAHKAEIKELQEELRKEKSESKKRMSFIKKADLKTLEEELGKDETEGTKERACKEPQKPTRKGVVAEIEVGRAAGEWQEEECIPTVQQPQLPNVGNNITFAAGHDWNTEEARQHRLSHLPPWNTNLSMAQPYTEDTFRRQGAWGPYQQATPSHYPYASAPVNAVPEEQEHPISGFKVKGRETLEEAPHEWGGYQDSSRTERGNESEKGAYRHHHHHHWKGHQWRDQENDAQVEGEAFLTKSHPQSEEATGGREENPSEHKGNGGLRTQQLEIQERKENVRGGQDLIGPIEVLPRQERPSRLRDVVVDEEPCGPQLPTPKCPSNNFCRKLSTAVASEFKKCSKLVGKQYKEEYKIKEKMIKANAKAKDLMTKESDEAFKREKQEKLRIQKECQEAFKRLAENELRAQKEMIKSLKQQIKEKMKENKKNPTREAQKEKFKEELSKVGVCEKVINAVSRGKLKSQHETFLELEERLEDEDKARAQSRAEEKHKEEEAAVQRKECYKLKQKDFQIFQKEEYEKLKKMQDKCDNVGCIVEDEQMSKKDGYFLKLDPGLAEAKSARLKKVLRQAEREKTLEMKKIALEEEKKLEKARKFEGKRKKLFKKNESKLERERYCETKKRKEDQEREIDIFMKEEKKRAKILERERRQEASLREIERKKCEKEALQLLKEKEKELKEERLRQLRAEEVRKQKDKRLCKEMRNIQIEENKRKLKELKSQKRAEAQQREDMLKEAKRVEKELQEQKKLQKRALLEQHDREIAENRNTAIRKEEVTY